MIIKVCEFCKGIIKTRFSTKRFCNRICQRRHYHTGSEVKEKDRGYMREYRKKSGNLVVFEEPPKNRLLINNGELGNESMR